MPILPFIDFQPSSSLNGPYTLMNDQISPAVAFSFSVSTLRSVVIEYSIIRSSTTEAGRILITTDGTNLGYSIDKENNTSGDCGIILTVGLSGSNVQISYVSTNTGQNGTIQYVQRNLNN